MRGLIGVVALALAMGACSDEGGDPERPEPSAGPSAEVRSLAETCPLVEQATPTGLAPSDAKIRDYQAELDRLATEGDAETANALRFMQDAVAHTLDAAQGSESAEAFSEWTDALDLLAERCEAVGSSAFTG